MQGNIDTTTNEDAVDEFGNDVYYIEPNNKYQNGAN
jgi:hypothetical protein